MIRTILPFLLISTAMGQPVFEGLGFVGFVTNLSADGTQLTGVFYPPENNSNTTAYLWSQATGPQSMGLFAGSSLTANDSYTNPRGMNTTTVVGYGRTSGAVQQSAFRWDAGVGYTLLANPSGYTSASASTVSADGSAIFGESFQYTDRIRYMATRWTTTGVITLGVLPGATSSFIRDVSADGNVAAGDSGGGGGFVWSAAGGLTPIPITPKAISADGVYVVGTTGSQAGRWSDSTGMIELGTLNAFHSSYATDVSADGNIVVGYAYNDSETAPFIWSAVTGMRDLRDVIVANGGDISGWSLYTNGGLHISNDGMTITGNGVGPNNFNEVWITRLTSIPEPSATGAWLAGLTGALACSCRSRRRSPTVSSA